jgi:hypothetical protein
MGEARTALLEGTEAVAMGSMIRAAGVGVKDRQRSIQRTIVYGPVCTMVGRGRAARPPIPVFTGRSSNTHPLLEITIELCNTIVAYVGAEII